MSLNQRHELTEFIAEKLPQTKLTAFYATDLPMLLAFQAMPLLCSVDQLQLLVSRIRTHLEAVRKLRG